MFGMKSSPSIRWQIQEAGLNRAAMRASEGKYKDYRRFIEMAATAIISDFDKLKNALEIAVAAYLNKIEQEFFRKDGRKRAQVLKDKITKTNNILELIPALEEAIKEGNEDADSLKTFLFKCIYLNFCDDKILKGYRYYESYTEFLEDIIKEVKKQLEPICLKTISEISEVGKDSERNLQTEESLNP